MIERSTNSFRAGSPLSHSRHAPRDVRWRRCVDLAQVTYDDRDQLVYDVIESSVDPDAGPPGRHKRAVTPAALQARRPHQHFTSESSVLSWHLPLSRNGKVISSSASRCSDRAPCCSVSDLSHAWPPFCAQICVRARPFATRLLERGGALGGLIGCARPGCDRRELLAMRWICCFPLLTRCWRFLLDFVSAQVFRCCMCSSA